MALALFFPVACAKRPDGKSPPNILLIMVDTLRADRVGGDRGAAVTPFLGELAAKSIVFSNAYAPSSWTRPSIASLFTSRFPSQHKVDSFLSRLGEDELTLAESLDRAGYVSGGFSANPHIATAGGFAQGFQHFEAFPGSRDKVRADHIARVALAWLDGVWTPAAPRPIFLYLHFMEPHGPYLAPQPYRDRFLRPVRFLQNVDPSRKVEKVVSKLSRSVSRTLVRGEAKELRKFEFDEIMVLRFLYDAEVASFDAELRLLFGELERRGFLENAVVVVTADHGEEFDEHGGMWHGRTLFNESIRIPLLIRYPGDQENRTVAENVSLVDLMPSLLELVGVPPVPTEGHSFVPLLADPWWLPRWLQGTWRRLRHRPDIVAELPRNENFMADPRVHVEAILRESVKAVVDPAGSVTLFDLATDAKEKRPNPSTLGNASAELIAALRGMQAEWSERSRRVDATHAVDEQTAERLRALGYPLTGTDSGAADSDAASERQ